MENFVSWEETPEWTLDFGMPHRFLHLSYECQNAREKHLESGMSLPDEKQRAVASVRQFLYNLLDPQKTPRVPKAVRQEARRVLKHYPFDCEIQIKDWTGEEVDAD